MNGWNHKRLDQLARIRRGASPRPIDDPRWFAREGPGWVRISDVTRANGRLRKTEQCLSPDGVERSVRVGLGDVLMSICATIGEPVTVEMDACIHDGFVVFDQFEGKLDRRFLLHMLRAIAPRLRAQGQTGTQANLNTGIVSGYRAFLPEQTDEQARIALVLDTVDEAIAKTEAVIAKLRQVRAGLLHDLLTRGLDAHGQLRDPIAHPEQFQDSPLGPIPKEWRVAPLGDVAELVQGGRLKLTKEKDYRSSGFPAYSAAGQDGFVAVAEFHQPGVVLSAIGAQCGKCFLAEGSWTTLANVCAILPKQDALLARWLFLQANQVGFWPRSGSAQPFIKPSDVRARLVLLPSPSEQSALCQAAGALNNCIEMEENCLAKLHQLKSGLMTDLLTGRVRVPLDRGGNA